MSLPELLSPVSTLETCQAAIHNGADAVYVGVPHWNARGRSPDLSLEELEEMVGFCRLRGVRIFFAMNVLVFESELQDLPGFLLELIRLHPDAFIVQDIGLARLLHQICPDQEIHASTQMTLASAEAIQCIADLDFARVVLARELSLDEIRELRCQVSCELEVFVHGALCVSYSGQCLTSENFGGRSANRGQCAQSCRLPYTLFVDGQKQNLHGRNYLFSPQDLCALAQLGDLVQAGVNSLKIEGRLKSPEYIAATTAIYRKTLDTGHWDAQQMQILESLFARGLFPGWLHGVNHQKLVDGHFSGHRGNAVGIVERVSHGGIQVRLDAQAPECEPGDGILFCSPDGEEGPGGRLYAIKTIPNGRIFEFRRDLDFGTVRSGWRVFRTDAPALEAAVRRSYTDHARWRRIPVSMSLSGAVGMPLVLKVDDGTHRLETHSSIPLEAARQVADPSWIREELAALGGSIYRLTQAEIQTDPGVFIPRKMVRELRQKICSLLDQARLQRPDFACTTVDKIVFPTSSQNAPVKTVALLNLLVRREDQLDALEPGLSIDTIFLDFDYGRKQDQALARIHALGYRTGIATLRVHKSRENRYLETIVQHQPNRVLVRSLGALQWLRTNAEWMPVKDPLTWVGDHSLNLCNSMAADWFVQQGLGTLHPSWDLNRQQLLELIHQYGGTPFEVG
ncbi:MAG TPA: U32 family peptidase, partial [Fibrobacteraceae bacterium]|nr:U32 family peptidase [Fibrobacteraceae bacterium]